MNTDINISLTFVLIAAPLLFLLVVISWPWVIRKTNFIELVHSHLGRYAPIYLIVGPPAITYFAVCGLVSALGMVAFGAIHEENWTREYVIQHGIFKMFRWIEYSCSFFGAYVFIRVIFWIRVSRLWIVVIAVSLSMSAAYRSIRNEPEHHFSSGPVILSAPDFQDAIPVLLGLFFCLMHQRFITERKVVIPSIR
jgi:hypothetical protein